MKPVSVIIPTYNRKNTIMTSVISVLEQTYEKLELIVVDDGSSDGTEEIFSQITDPRLRYHYCPSNRGVSYARNLGASLAQYDLLAFNDSDDVWHSDKLEKQMSYITSHPNSILVYCPFIRYLGDESMRVPPFDRDILELKGYICKFLLGSNTIGAPTILISKDNYNMVGMYDEKYPALEDWDFAIRAARLGEIGYVDEVLVDVMSSPGGVSSNMYNYFEARCMLLKKYYNDICSYELLNPIMMDILRIAEKWNVLEQVKKMLMLSLAEVRKIL